MIVGRQEITDPRVDHLPLVGNECLTGDFVFRVDVQAAVLVQVEQKCRDVLRKHLAGVVRDFGRQVGWAEECHAVFDDGLIRLRQFAVSTALGGQVDNDRPGPHAADGVGGDESRRRTPGNGRGGNTDVTFGHDAGHQVALPLVERFVHLLCVTAFTFGRRCFDLHFDEFRAQAFDLLFDSGTHVVPLDNGSQAPRRSDGLEPRHARANDKDPGRGECPGGGHEHGKEFRQVVGGQQDRLVSRDGRHRRQHVHALRPRDPRDQFECKQGHTLLGKFLAGGGVAERIAHANDDLALTHLLQVGSARFAIGTKGPYIGDHVGAK